MILKQKSRRNRNKLGDNIATVTNNFFHTFLKNVAVVKCLPCFSIIAGRDEMVLPDGPRMMREIRKRMKI